ncbi:ATPase family associated protein [Perilla frutescens var. frutescens]|nr:ATPase family associated protein [Perilla frutescens var. frutescens]
MLWVDKYRPKTLDKVLVHEDIAQNLKKLVTEQDCPHLLFYGPSGSGKKTLIMALLRQIFGPGADKVKVENKNWKVDAGARTIDIELTTASSAHHVEMNPSDAGFQDRYVVQEIIKEMAKNPPIDTKGKKGFKVLVLNEVDKLSREAQHSLRRTMEKYSSPCRLILCSNSSSKVTEAIRSRCLNMRINAPTEGEIVKVLEFIGKKEGLQLPPGFADRIAQQSNRSLRRAILLFETCRVQQYPFAPNQAITPMDWEEYVSEIASGIFKEQSPKRMMILRLIHFIAKEKGVSTDKISDWDVFLRLHTGADGVFTDGKSKRIAADFRAHVEEMSQGQQLDDSAEGDGGGIDMSSLFVDVVGVSEKKRVFGLGNRSHVYSASSGESHSSTSQVNTNVINNFEDRLQILENQLQESQEQLQKRTRRC